MPARRPVDVPIRDESIRLGQFLKLADLAETGSDAKELILAGEVLVNGEPETRRGRQLRVGDVVEFDGRAARVARPPGSAAFLAAGRGFESCRAHFWLLCRSRWSEGWIDVWSPRDGGGRPISPDGRVPLFLQVRAMARLQE
jgi:ribosome-associated protein